MDKPKKSNISETHKKIIDLKRFVQIGLGFYLWAMIVTWVLFRIPYGFGWISQDEWWVGLNIVGGFAVAWVLDAFVFQDNVEYSLVKDEI